MQRIGIERRLEKYEGLVKATGRLLEGRVERHDLDDICQRLRVKAWRALRDYDSTNELSEDRYVFMCLMSEKKDLLKRVRRGEHLLDDLTAPAGIQDDSARAEWVERTFFAVAEDDAYAGVADALVLPSTLDARERHVVYLLYTGAKQGEIAAELGLRRPDVQAIERTVREKLEDWRPLPRPPHPLTGRKAPALAQGAGDPQRQLVP